MHERFFIIFAHSTWPVPIFDLAFFVSFCYQQGYSPSTVNTYMSPVSFVHKVQNLNDPIDSFVLKKILEGFKRFQSRKDLRAPITEDILVKIVESLPFICYNQYATIFGESSIRVPFITGCQSIREHKECV